MDPEEFVAALSNSLDTKYSQVADLVEFLHSMDFSFFGEVMTLMQSRYRASTNNNCDMLEITEKVWNLLFWQAKYASQNGEDQVSYRILKVILDGSETHPWPLPSSDNFLN